MKLSKMATIADCDYFPKPIGLEWSEAAMTGSGYVTAPQKAALVPECAGVEAAVADSGYITVPQMAAPVPQMAAPVPECAGEEEEDELYLKVSQEWTLN